MRRRRPLLPLSLTLELSHSHVHVHPPTHTHKHTRAHTFAVLLCLHTSLTLTLLRLPLSFGNAHTLFLDVFLLSLSHSLLRTHTLLHNVSHYEVRLSPVLHLFVAVRAAVHALHLRSERTSLRQSFFHLKMRFPYFYSINTLIL